MLYGFKIAQTLNRDEPGAAYFRHVEQAAREAVGSAEPLLGDAEALCEYLDCVDSGAWPLDKLFYSRCVYVLSEFLATARCPEVRGLAAKSWAAATLLDVVRAGLPQDSVRKRCKVG